MARNKKMLLIVIAIILVIATLVFFIWYLWDVMVFIQNMSKEKDQRQFRLLCETDHQALLDACSELSRRVARGDLKPGQYNISHDPHPDIASFPQIIIDLGPNRATIGNYGEVRLEMMGGLDHFGVSFYPDNYKKPPFVGFNLGDKKLIDGLWYYDDGYEDNPRYDNKIEALLKKRK